MRVMGLMPVKHRDLNREPLDLLTLQALDPIAFDGTAVLRVAGLWGLEV